MKTSKELMDKLCNALNTGDQDELTEVLMGIVKDKAFHDEFVKKLNEELEKNGILTTTDISKSLGFEQESAPVFKFNPSTKSSKPKKSTKPVYKTYEDLAYISAMETTRCHMLIDKLKATIKLLDAQQQYYEAMSIIERDNETFGFDLSI